MASKTPMATIDTRRAAALAERSGRSQAEVARLAEITPSALSQILNCRDDQKRCKRRTLEGFAKACDPDRADDAARWLAREPGPRYCLPIVPGEKRPLRRREPSSGELKITDWGQLPVLGEREDLIEEWLKMYAWARRRPDGSGPETPAGFYELGPAAGSTASAIPAGELLSIEDIIGKGQTAHVFAREGCVLKVFLRHDVGRSHERMRAVCAAEMNAYRIVALTPGLVPHAPRFYGQKSVIGVRDRNGRDCSDRYLLDTCYAIERLNDKPISVFEVPKKYSQAVKQLMERFEAAGIDYVEDADVVGWRTPETMKLLDFATYDARAEVND